MEQALRAVCGRLDLTVRRVPPEHAGGKWRLSYRAVDGGTGTIEMDLNFVLRTPLWPVAVRDARPLAPGAAVTRFPVLDPHELAAGKLAFFDRLNGTGEIAPELVTDDARLHAILRAHPGLQWKAINVRRRLGGVAAPTDGELTA